MVTTVICPDERTAASSMTTVADGVPRSPALLSGPMAYRVIQWATGNVGRAAAEGIVAHPDLELVGAWVHSPDKAGRDAAQLADIAPGDEERLLALDADCVLYSPLLPDTAQVIRILESGKNVV